MPPSEVVRVLVIAPTSATWPRSWSGVMESYQTDLCTELQKVLGAARREGPPSLILIDAHWPAVEAASALRELRAWPGLQRCPVVLVAESADLAHAEQVRAAWGADDVVDLACPAPIVGRRLELHLRAARLQQQEDDNRDLSARIRHGRRELVSSNRNLEKLVEIGMALGSERDRMALLRTIIEGGRELANCEAATLFLMTERRTLRFELRTHNDSLPVSELHLYEPETGEPVHRYVATHVALSGEVVAIDDVYKETRFDLSGTKSFSQRSGMRAVSMLAVPMSPRSGEVIGVLQFINAQDPDTDEIIPFGTELRRILSAMASQAAVALENLQLIDSQDALMDSLIRMISGAIDAKSPYTGGHNQRVPELAFMLAQAATEVREGPLASFAFATEDEWREFRIGAWLHDCGKVTSPEYVMDKASKLETIYNRIHEVRTRFEVLLRDAEIQALRAEAAGQDAAAVWAAFEARRQQLQDDFEFVAECNLGGEFMAPERVERLRRIAEQTWLRHFDDRAGLTDAELKRYVGEPAPLPAIERLLSDKPEHIVPRTEHQKLDPRFRFQIKVPDNLYNHGEIYNLAISRGTLNDEERFKVNEHIIQTIMMLEQLPLPKGLRRVPEYAGTHHETLIGTGYPRKLTEKELSIPARIMAIADIFEALSAPDRPYKKTKKLSECVQILWTFKKNRHIDPVLFDLFLETGIYRAYAERFMLPEQIDAVNVSAYLGPVPLTA